MSALANWSNLIRPSVAASIYLLIGIFPTYVYYCFDANINVRFGRRLSSFLKYRHCSLEVQVPVT